MSYTWATDGDQDGRVIETSLPVDGVMVFRTFTEARDDGLCAHYHRMIRNYQAAMARARRLRLRDAER